MSDKVADLQRAMSNLLTPTEQSEFLLLLNSYHASRDIQALTWGLAQIFDTPAKRSLISLLSTLLPQSHVGLFEKSIKRNLETIAHLQDNRTSRSAGPSSRVRYHTLAGPTRRQKANPGQSGSLRSLPAQGYQTLPSRRHPGHSSEKVTPKVIRRPAAEGEFGSRNDLSNWEAGIIRTGETFSAHTQSNPRQAKTVCIEQPSSRANTGLGFSIRGGAEHGIGVYVSYVEVDSIGDRQGLTPGDQILAVNGVSFDKISHDEAAKIIRCSSKLELQVRNVGRVPGSFETHQRYMWIDGQGRATSPPPEVDRTGRYDASGERRSELMLLKDCDERKVNLVLDDTKTLGLKIRGGNEFGLGVYVTDVDPMSPAEKASIRVGDQILDVNGTSFLDISHNEAAKVLKAFRHQMLTIKDVGKIPIALTTIDQTQWVTGNQQQGHPQTTFRHSLSTSAPGPLPVGKSHRNVESIFSRGVGSQLMHSAAMSQKSQWALVEERARHLLSESERLTLSYYLGEYQQGSVKVDDLILALCQLLNSPSKMQIMTEIRGVITPKDLEKFDNKLNRQKSVRSSKRKKKTDLGVPGREKLEHRSKSPTSRSPATPSKHLMHDSTKKHTVNTSMSSRDFHPLHLALRQIGEAHEVDMPLSTEEIPPPSAFTNNTLRGTEGSRMSHIGPGRAVVVADVHHPMSGKNHSKLLSVQQDEICSPSEDSGVEVNGHNGPDASSKPTTQSMHVRENLWTSPSSRVTLSSKEPVIINDVLKHSRHESDDDDELVTNLPQPFGHPLPSHLSNEQLVTNVTTSRSYPSDNISKSIDRKAWKENAMAKARKKSHRNSADDFDMNTKQHDAKVRHAVVSRSPNRKQNGENNIPLYAVPNKLKQRSRSKSPNPRHRGENDMTLNGSNLEKRRSRSATSTLHRASNGFAEETYGSNFSSDQAAFENVKNSENEIQTIQNMYPVHKKLELEVNEYLSDDALPQRLRHLKLTDINLDSSSLSDTIANPTTVRRREQIMQPPPSPSLQSWKSNGYDEISKLSTTSHSRKGLNNVHQERSVSNGGFGGVGSDRPSRKGVEKAIAPVKPPRKHRPSSVPAMGGMHTQQDRSRKPTKSRESHGDAEIHEVVIVKDKPTLGIAIEGGAHTRQPLPRVIQIHPAGSAAGSKLKVGDILLEVNGVSLDGMEHAVCARTIAEAFKNRNTSTMLLQILKEHKKQDRDMST